MKFIRALFVILLLLLVIIVAVQNYAGLTVPVIFKIDLMIWDHQTTAMPLAFIAIITFLLGVIIMGLYGITERFNLKRRIRILQKEAREREKELNGRRNLPVATEETELDSTSHL